MHPTTPIAASSAELSAGAWLRNPVTGELARMEVGPADTDGVRVEAQLWLQPGAAVAGAHVHPHLAERFTVLEGEVGFALAGEESTVHAGDPTLEIPAGDAHDWWNTGAGAARVLVEVEAVPGAPGRPAARFVEMIEALWGLGALGRTNAKGMPSPLWLAAVAREYRDVLRFTSPPGWVQAALFAPLAGVARALGRDPRAPELHGVRGAACVPDAIEAELQQLLRRPVGARG